MLRGARGLVHTLKWSRSIILGIHVDLLTDQLTAFQGLLSCRQTCQQQISFAACRLASPPPPPPLASPPHALEEIRVQTCPTLSLPPSNPWRFPLKNFLRSAELWLDLYSLPVLLLGLRGFGDARDWRGPLHWDSTTWRSCGTAFFLRFCSFFVFKSLLLSVALSAYCLCEKMRAGGKIQKSCVVFEACTCLFPDTARGLLVYVPWAVPQPKTMLQIASMHRNEV